MLTVEQNMLSESAARFAREFGGVERRLKRLAAGGGCSDGTHWQQFADNGWLGAVFPEAVGGFDGGAQEMAIIMEAIGHGLLLEPFLSCVVLGGGIVERLGTEQQKQALLTPMITGTMHLALAFVEGGGGHDLSRIGTRLNVVEQGYLLEGRKIAVFDGDRADVILTTARLTDNNADRIVVAAVPKTAPGVKIQGYATIDGLRGSNVMFSGVPLRPEGLLGDGIAASDALHETMDTAAVAVGAEAVGAMSALLAVTIEYLKTRKQFGRALSDNQALQHRVVDMYIAIEESKVLVADAVRALSQHDASDRQRAVSAAKAHIGTAARLVGQEAVQLHGAIGTTDEYIVGHYFRRLTAICQIFGNRDWHLRRISDLLTKRAA